ncbi:NAD(P)-binding protein [Aaosphaeria arxii CBS 175.79]|uniref:NAD(P)-binding protein n=1 Tax=Aaosphaeria arxii CBS 175.79 TaxID=1450172 RepID=A0A6A5XDD8_9PLEO|nr:NAD(P)-binding protein [Aaosphaeria arxii CBS 175.79]KAF2010921.1 NAD(P)-binding protein [Aaosphaeria arxii CBS 175.79]
MAPPNDKPSLKSVLVTGGCGFIGHHLVSAILEVEPNCKVYAFDIDTNRPSRQHASAIYITGDITDPSAVDAAFAAMANPPLVIFHIACPPSMEPDPQLHWRVSVEGTRNLLATADRDGGTRVLVLTSSTAVGYDDVAELRDVKELPVLDASKQSRSYSLAKGVSEQEVIAANRKNANGMLTCALRPCTTFGPDDPLFFENILNVVKRGQEKYRFGSGENLYDFVYVDNVCHAHLLAARALIAAHREAPLPAAERVEGEVFNITNDERIPFWDFTMRTSNLFGSPITHNDVVSIPKPIGLTIGFLAEWLVWAFSLGKRRSAVSTAAVRYAVSSYTLNIDKANERLQYSPPVGLQEGLDRTVDWYKKQRKW